MVKFLLGNPECQVTPCIGVWIEIIARSLIKMFWMVTPCIGVWIEMKNGSFQRWLKF